MIHLDFKKYRDLLLILSLLVLMALNLAHPIRLDSIDLGRHIKNGQLLLDGHTDILYKNFYSFTCPDYPFINHHWLFGVIVFLICRTWGFFGLSVFYIALLLAGYLLFFDCSRRMSNSIIVLLFSLLSFALLVFRWEIRPEGISLFLMGCYFCLLQRFKDGMVPSSVLLGIIPLLQILWVNSHIYFPVGPLIIAIFLWQVTIEREGDRNGKEIRVLQWLLGLSILVNLINPSGWRGMMVPVLGFEPTGYPILEDQNFLYTIKYFSQEIKYRYFFISVYIWAFFLLLGAFLTVRFDGFRRHAPMLFLTLFVLTMGMYAFRLLGISGFISIYLFSYFYGLVFKKAGLYPRIQFLLIAGVLLGLGFWFSIKPLDASLGLSPNVNASSDYYKHAGLKGPVFNNYTIGGYLIFHFAPEQKFFIDNRNDGYPNEFLKSVFCRMQEDPATWKLVDEKYKFNVIYLSRVDATHRAQKFYIDRLKDPEWSRVYIDRYAVIFVRRKFYP